MSYEVYIAIPWSCYIDLGDYPKGRFNVYDTSEEHLWTLANIESAFLPCVIVPSPLVHDPKFLVSVASHVLKTEPHDFYLLHNTDVIDTARTEPLPTQTIDFATFERWCLEWKEVWLGGYGKPASDPIDPRIESGDYLQLDVLYKIVP